MVEDERRENAVQAASESIPTRHPTDAPLPAPGTPAAEQGHRSDAAEALEALFREHHARVFRAALRITGRCEDAEDALQTVFLRLARQNELDLAPSPGSYLHRAAVNAALDLVRRRASSPDVSLDETPVGKTVNMSRHPRSQEDEQLSREIRDVVRRALASLPQRSAEIFALRYFEGYGNHEIARMVGTSAGSIAVSLHRTRQLLKDRIRPLLGETP
ncbi:MAG: sigma-70 family RNA polymerase sigma factor [Acidobacteriota bacterium]|nr:MAG: sigma-70 family RNA polymerase sigma factor [Acidobacteriota bacterium]